MRRTVGIFRKNFFSGIYEIMVLLILRKNLSPMYGYQIAKLIQEYSDGMIRIGASALYNILNKLEKAGYLRGMWKESESGPPRKYYTITPEGELFMRNLLSQWEATVRLISKLRKSKKRLVN